MQRDTDYSQINNAATSDASTLAPNLSREEEAKLALENTVVSRGVALLLVLCFLLTIVCVPTVQHVVEIKRNTALREKQIAAGESPDQTLWPQSYDVFSLLPTTEKLRTARTLRDAQALIPEPQEIEEYEDALEENSVINQWILPRAQSLLTKSGAGNEQAYIGRENWLMYRPDVDYVTQPGFLDAARLQARERAGDATSEATQPNPVKAILDFARQLKARDIQLLVVVAPVKASIHPEKLSSRFSRNEAVLQNASFIKFKAELTRNGILIFDAAPLLKKASQKMRTPQYLLTDTHWTPAAMELVARNLASFIQENDPLPQRENTGYARKNQTISNSGDIATMLKLPQSQSLFGKQTVIIHPVQNADGEAWYPRRNADILLLGDSFTNIYSLGGMGWGEAAGFAEQLSFALQRPLDRIAINAGGALAARQELSKQIKRGRDRLRGKRLVIYQFAARDLLVGDWKLLPMSAPQNR